MAKAKIDFKYDKNSIDNIEKFFNEKHKINIGILANEIRPDGFGAVELALVHEFGSFIRHIPQRSFMRKTLNDRKGDFQDDLIDNSEKIMIKIAKGNGEKILQKAGALWVKYVMETFDAEGPGWQKLADITLLNRRNYQVEKEKDSKASPAELLKRTRAGSKILQDTGEMKKSITFEVK